MTYETVGSIPPVMVSRLHSPFPRTAARLLLALVLVLELFSGAGSVAAASRHRIALNTSTDFVAQTNFVQCVGASMQMMVNMIRTNDDRSATTQLELQNIARYWSGSRPDGRQRQGASVRGWAAGLTTLGVGPYMLVGRPTIEEAMHEAAIAIAETGKPVGLLVWRGRHAWVMSGFEASADPLATDDFAVTHAMVMDPLYPYGSSVWGPSPKPGQALTLEQLGRQFVARRQSSQSALGTSSFGPASTLSGMYVLVVPYEVREPGTWSERVL
jgi:hypothetical protein